ncbi:Uncharacterised protein [Escherichia coli]|uniref:Uncharacterized protein n=1 Tax=Escherichia coli TaxID=562 RepID=A0A2X1MVB2_ECOLX|nr:Uncharacterised protein [Escherichia coli]
MTYMKLTAAKRIVFLYIYCNPVLEKRQFSNESQLKNLPGYNEGRAGK